MSSEQRRAPRDEEEAAAFKGMGHAIATIRECRGMGRDELASRCEMTPAELEEIERGELDESWGDLRVLATELDIPLPLLLTKADKLAPGPGGEKWRQSAGEVEGKSGGGGRRGR